MQTEVIKEENRCGKDPKYPLYLRVEVADQDNIVVKLRYRFRIHTEEDLTAFHGIEKFISVVSDLTLDHDVLSRVANKGHPKAHSALGWYFRRRHPNNNIDMYLKTAFDLHLYRAMKLRGDMHEVGDLIMELESPNPNIGIEDLREATKIHLASNAIYQRTIMRGDPYFRYLTYFNSFNLRGSAVHEREQRSYQTLMDLCKDGGIDINSQKPAELNSSILNAFHNYLTLISRARLQFPLKPEALN